MKLKIMAIAVLFSALGLSSCNKKAGKYNEDFLGHWRTDPYSYEGQTAVYRNEIIIEESDGAYRNECKDTCAEKLCECLNDLTGTPVVNKQRDKLKIGSSNGLTLSIDQEPSIDSSGRWMMIIGERVYYKE